MRSESLPNLAPSQPHIPLSLSITLLATALVVAIVATAGPNAYSGLGIDEHVTHYIATGTQPATVFERSQFESATPPLYFWLVRGSLALGPQRPSEWRLRLPSLVAYAASIIVIFVIAEKLIGPGTGGIAALLLAAHPAALTMAGESRPYALGMLENLVAAGCLFRLRASNWSWRHVVGFIAADAALLWTHYLFVVLLPAQFLAAYFAFWKPSAIYPAKKQRKPIGMAAIAVMLIVASFALFPLGFGIARLLATELMGWTTNVRSWYQQLEIVPHGWCFLVLFVVLLLARCLGLSGANATVAQTFLSVPKQQIDGPRHRQECLCHRWLGGLFSFETDAGGTPRSLGVLGALAIWLLVPIYTLWVASLWRDVSLAQPRYFAIQAGPAVLFLVAVLRAAVGIRGALVLAIVLVVVDYRMPIELVDRLRRPDRIDRNWQQAAVALNQLASEKDLVLVQSGLVETANLPAAYTSPGTQEYLCSRLDDFYLEKPLRRLALPRFWQDGAWLRDYNDQVRQTIASGGAVWTVVSADLDLGVDIDRKAAFWLRHMGLDMETIRDARVARVRVFRAAASERK